MNTKYCNKCKQEKPVSDFHKNSSLKDGLQFYCKACQCAKKSRNTAINERITTDNPLARFTPRDLMKELHNRGYEGQLTYINRIDISKI